MQVVADEQTHSDDLGNVPTPRRRFGRGASQNLDARRNSRPHPYGNLDRRSTNRLPGTLSTDPNERPRISYLEGSEGVEILGGNFVTTEGDYIGEVIYNNGVTINNYSAPPPAPATTRVDGSEVVTGNDPTPLPIQRSCDVYNRHLACKGRGFPLWIPEPNNNLSMEYRRRGIDIGDVGIITKMGNFDFLFNICLPEDHPINRDGVPEGFSPCKPVRPSDIQRFTEFEAGAFLTSTSVDKSRFEGEYLNGTLIFESSAMEGAILTLPDGAETLDLANVLHFERYMAKNVTNWYKYVLVERGRHVENGEVRLVVGRDNSRTWGMATFEKASTHGNALQLKFRPMEENTLGARRYVWESSGAASARTGPSRAQVEEMASDINNDNITNQTLFVRTINARLKSKSWKKLTSTIKQELTRLYKDQESYTDAPDTLASSPSSSGSSSNTGADVHRETSEASMFRYKGLAYMDSNPPVARIAHPADVLNELALQNLAEDSDEVEIIITRDADWISVISENDLVLPPAEELLKRIMKHHTLQMNKEDGFVFFGPNSADGTISSLTQPWTITGGPSTPVSSARLSMPSTPMRVSRGNVFEGSSSLRIPPQSDNPGNSMYILNISERSSAASLSEPLTPRRGRAHRDLPHSKTDELDAEYPGDMNQHLEHYKKTPFSEQSSPTGSLSAHSMSEENPQALNEDALQIYKMKKLYYTSTLSTPMTSASSRSSASSTGSKLLLTPSPSTLTPDTYPATSAQTTNTIIDKSHHLALANRRRVLFPDTAGHILEQLEQQEDPSENVHV